MPNRARKFAKLLRKRLGFYQPKIHYIPAVLGNQSEEIEVPGEYNLVYVTTHEGQVLEVLNAGVTLDMEAGTPVLLVFDDVDKRLKVVGLQDVYNTNTSVPKMFAHWKQHQWPGGYDVLWVKGEQILPNLGAALSGMTVRLMGGMFHTGTQWQSYPTQDIDLTSYQPSSQARMALLQIASDKTVTVKLGVLKSGKTELTAADIPNPDAGCHPICAVKLSSGMTEITNDGTSNSDMIDLRFARFATAVGVGTPLSLGADDIPYSVADQADWWYYPNEPDYVSDALDELAWRLSMVEIDVPDASIIPYSVLDPTDWNYYPTEPDYVAQALDELANRVATLEGAPPGAADASTTSYTPAVSADWDYYLNEPDYVNVALDELADRLTALEDAGSGPHVHDASATTYTPAVSADWDYYLNEPDYVDNALDELADRTTVLELTPIDRFPAFDGSLYDTDLWLIKDVSVDAHYAAQLSDLADYVYGEDGWHKIPVPASGLTRISDTQFTALSDWSEFFRKGAKVKWVDSGGTKYGVVESSNYSPTVTTVNLVDNDDYAIVSSGFNEVYVSFIELPVGFPDFFNYSPSWSAKGSMTISSVSEDYAKWSIQGLKCFAFVSAAFTLGGTADNIVYASSPVTCDESTQIAGAINIRDAGSGGAIDGQLRIDSSNGFSCLLRGGGNWSLGSGRQLHLTAIFSW